MDEKTKRLGDQFQETSYAIHEYHGKGHLEKVYENALAYRLRILLSFVAFALFRG